MSPGLRIVVCGYLVRGPIGGMAWHHLQYVLGLHLLGHDVIYLEDSDWYESCYDPTTGTMGTDPAYGLRFTEDAFRRLEMAGSWAYYDQHTDRWLGPLGGEAPTIAADADLLIDLSAVNPPRSWWETIPTRVLVDTDPAFTQLRHLDDPAAEAAAGAHTHFFTFAENIGRTGCGVPDDGHPWRPTRQPVVMACWPVTPGPPGGDWTTLMQWDSYPPRRRAGIVYGMKSRSFEDYWDLPRCRPGRRFRLAVGSSSAPRTRLAESGWVVQDPLPVSRDPWAFRRFVQGSLGELSVAKHGYVVSRSGWFSERSTGYLASGRPVVVQDTGFTEWLPAGDGVLAFSSLEEALAGIDAVERRYRDHCAAARNVAERYFDHRRVLEPLVREALDG